MKIDTNYFLQYLAQNIKNKYPNGIDTDRIDFFANDVKKISNAILLSFIQAQNTAGNVSEQSNFFQLIRDFNSVIYGLYGIEAKYSGIKLIDTKFNQNTTYDLKKNARKIMTQICNLKNEQAYSTIFRNEQKVSC